MITVEIYSDVVCPWCYIGKRRWEKALAALVMTNGEEVLEQIQVAYRPYQLDPTAPTEPSPVIAVYAKKFGGADRAAEIIATVTQAAKDEGLDFRMDIAQRANTQSSHRLLEFALHSQLPDGQSILKERLLHAYFSEGLDIGDSATLMTLAAEVGFDSEVVGSFLQSDGGVEQLQGDLQGAAEIGVTAVPTFVFNGEFAVPGAQDPEVFVRVLTKLLAAQA